MNRTKMLIICTVVLAAAGYFGNSFVHGDPGPSAKDVARGEKIWNEKCAACHPNGTTPADPSLPVVGSSTLKSLAAFTKFNRNPVKSDRTKGTMPAFPPDSISKADMAKLYAYSVETFGKKK
jgi:mono/diheme cytochrome c family protein